MSDTRFKKMKEDFNCDHCGAIVVGNGYTNHCPKCLWSKHVDEFPGDRAAECNGAMEPIGLITTGKDWVIVHRCQKCSKTIKNRKAVNDDSETIISLSKKILIEAK